MNKFLKENCYSYFCEMLSDIHSDKEKIESIYNYINKTDMSYEYKTRYLNSVLEVLRLVVKEKYPHLEEKLEIIINFQ